MSVLDICCEIEIGSGDDEAFLCDLPVKGNSRLSHSLFRDMSNRTSEDLANAIEVPDPNNYEAGDDEEEVFEASELDSAADETPAVGGDAFMHTDDFRRLFVGFVMVDTLVPMRWLDKNGTR